MNFLIKWLSRSKNSPLTNFFLFIISIISQACSPFHGPVDKSISDSYYYSKWKNDIYYSPMGNWFELGKTKLNVDIDSFELIGREFGKDKNHIYFKSNIIDDEVDKATFRVSEDNIICFDKSNVYVAFNYISFQFGEDGEKNKYLWKIENADPESFTRIDSDWAKDNHKYYYNYAPINVDYTSFKILNKNFAKDKDRVYLLKSHALLYTTSIDTESAYSINDRYIADKNAVHDFQEYQNNKVTDSLTSFSHKNLKTLRIIDNEYILFDDKVIYDGSIIENADINTFEPLRTPYSRDYRQIFYDGNLIENADPETFEIFENIIYAKDQNHIYAYGKILRGADVATFGPVKNEYSMLYKDKNHTYRGDKIIEE